MIKKLLAYFESASDNEPTLTADEAVAVLFIEVMMADHDADQREEQCIQEILSKRLKSSPDEISKLIETAKKRQKEAHDLYEYTRVINDAYTEVERFEVMVDLWKIAFADESIDKYEDHRIRRVAELLHLHHSHFIRAKDQANPARRE